MPIALADHEAQLHGPRGRRGYGRKAASRPGGIRARQTPRFASVAIAHVAAQLTTFHRQGATLLVIDTPPALIDTLKAVSPSPIWCSSRRGQAGRASRIGATWTARLGGLRRCYRQTVLAPEESCTGLYS
jgi:hypothetical protein